MIDRSLFRIPVPLLGETVHGAMGGSGAEHTPDGRCWVHRAEDGSRCPNGAVFRVTTGCEHEHLDRDETCRECAAILREAGAVGGLHCYECRKVGHFGCRVMVLEIVPLTRRR